MSMDIKMEQIYKQLYKDEEGRYIFATEEDTRMVVSQEAYIMIYQLELLQKILEKEEERDMTNKEETNGEA